MKPDETNPANHVVQVCVEGMEAEIQGRLEEARRLFATAWDLRANDFDACVAAHYVARHQPTPEDCLHWNQEALNRAQLVSKERVANFWPSLYLNVGHSQELLCELDAASRHYNLAASRHYNLAAAHLGNLEEGDYGDIIRNGIQEGKRRVGEIRVHRNSPTRPTGA